jgi:hypothetical protein
MLHGRIGAVIAGCLLLATITPAAAAQPAISSYFIGTWTCDTAASPVVKAYGMIHGDALGLSNAYVTPYPYELKIYLEEYVQRGRTITVTARSGGSTFVGTSAGWDSANRLLFVGSVTGTGPVTHERMTYRKGPKMNQFQRTFETASGASGPWTTISRETCFRHGVPAKP